MPISLKAGLGGGGGGLIELAPQPGRFLSEQVISLALQTTEQLALSLTGKFAVSAFALQASSTGPLGTISARLIVDGEEILNGSTTNGASSFNLRIYGNAAPESGTLLGTNESQFLCRESLQLYVTLPEAKATKLKYSARPIK
jgi:hypothetical protein